MKKLLFVVALLLVAGIVFLILKPRVNAPIIVKETITKQTKDGSTIIIPIAKIPENKIDKSKLESVEGSVSVVPSKPKNKVFIVTKSSEVVILANDPFSNGIGILFDGDKVIVYGKQEGSVDYNGKKVKKLFVESYGLIEKNEAKYQVKPDSLDIKLPNGEKVVAHNIRSSSSKIVIPDGVEVVLNVRVVSETLVTGVFKQTNLVLETENGKMFLPSNAPYVNTLRTLTDKSVTIKGVTISKTSFKGYPAIYITDILEVN